MARNRVPKALCDDVSPLVPWWSPRILRLRWWLLGPAPHARESHRSPETE